MMPSVNGVIGENRRNHGAKGRPTMGMVRVQLKGSGVFIGSAQEAHETLRDRQETNVKQIRS
jgi:hypothetical protein